MTAYIGDSYPKVKEPFHYKCDDDIIKLYYKDEIIGIYTYYCSPETIKEDIEEFSKESYENKR